MLRHDGHRVWSCRHQHGSTAQARACAEQELRAPGSSELGLRLRELRRAAGLTMRQAADTLDCSEAKVSRLENGKVGVSPRDVRDLLDLYQVTGKPRAAMLRAAQHARWLRRRGGKPSPPDNAAKRPGR